MARGTKAQVRELFHALTGEYSNPANFESGWSRVVKAAVRRWNVSEDRAEAALGASTRAFFAGRGNAEEALADALRALAPVEPEQQDGPAAVAAPAEEAQAQPEQDAPPAERQRRRRTGTKQEAVIALLRRPEGADVSQIAKLTGWKSHTIRGFLSVLGSKRGVKVVGAWDERRYVYRIAPAPEVQ